MEVLEQMPPFLGGGDMITEVTLERSLFAGPPLRFEAGTPPIIEAIGLHAAIDYVEAIGMEAIEAHERSLVDHAMKRLGNIDGVTLLGRAQDRGGVFAFSLDNAHSHDLATLLDRAGICVRSGRHCAEPLHARFGVESTCRASFGLYTTHEEVDYLAEAVRTSAFARSETVLQLAWVLGGIFACIIPTDATIGMYAAAVVLLTWTALVVAWNAGRGPRLTSWGRGPRT